MPARFNGSSTTGQCGWRPQGFGRIGVDTDGRTTTPTWLIAAFARRLRATLVTNNTADFTDLDVPVIDWTADQSGS